MIKTSIALAVLSLVSAESDVHSLTTDTFEPFIKAPLSLVSFTAPWCGHCKAMKPEYEVAATKLKEHDIQIANVDCTVEVDLCSDQGVKGYPTVKVFRDGVSSEFKGARTADSIIAVMVKQSLPALSVLKDTDAVKAFSTEHKVVLVGYFASVEDEEFKTFQAFSDSHRDDYVFGYTLDADAASAMEATLPQIILYKTFDELKNVFTGDVTAELLESFAKDNSVPLMDDLGPDNYAEYVKIGKPIVYLFVDSPESRKTIGDFCEPLAKLHKKELSFAFIDAAKYGGHGKTLNLKETWPGIVIQDTVKQTKYPLDQSVPYTEEIIKAHIAAYVAGELEPSMKSEEAPEDNDGPVTIVVGSTYESIVFDKSKDVFIEHYAPWCGHCKKLSPIWDELGEHLKGSKVVIAKMDNTENDLPASAGYEVEGFPTLKLIKADTNEVVDYEGDRSMEDLFKFIKENAAHHDSFEEMTQSDEPEQAEEHDEL